MTRWYWPVTWALYPKAKRFELVLWWRSCPAWELAFAWAERPTFIVERF